MPSFVPLEVTAIEDDGFHLMVEVKINGVPARMLVDTGASRSVFDKERIHRFFSDSPVLEENEQKSTGLGTRDMQSQALYLDNLQIGELVIRKYFAVVLDMSHVNLSYDELGMQAIDGVLGSDILMKYGASIDYGKRVMRINKRRKRLTVKK
jgi:clan AA aspartic protease (TIGR02281 family)